MYSVRNDGEGENGKVFLLKIFPRAMHIIANNTNATVYMYVCVFVLAKDGHVCVQCTQNAQRKPHKELKFHA